MINSLQALVPLGLRQLTRLNMKIKCLKLEQLSRPQFEAWSALQRADSAFDSPFFRPEFSQLVAKVRSDVEVAVLESGDRCVGFWPYQRDARNVARPVGLYLSDFQGVVSEPGVDWSPLDLLEQCGLSAWRFDHLIASQTPLHEYHWESCSSPNIDLRSGFADYCRRKRSEGSTVEKVLRKIRIIEREVGPIQLVPYSGDERVLSAVFEWKRAQYRRAHSIDFLAPGWVRELLRRVAEFQSDEFSGMLSAVYAGDHLVAGHLGIRSRNLLHAWFPVYNPAFQKYSPGLIFWLTIAEHAANLDIRRIDLGKGDHRFKQSLKTGETLVAEGAVDPHLATYGLRKGWWLFRRLVRSSPLAGPLRSLLRPVRAFYTRFQ